MAESVAFYRDRLAFDVRALVPAHEPFFAIVGRGDAQILLKCVSADVAPRPNVIRHASARWRAFVHATDPDAQSAEVLGRGAVLREPLGDHDDGLRGFAVEDADGYVLFFGCTVGTVGTVGTA